jgi:hypothetical protein
VGARRSSAAIKELRQKTAIEGLDGGVAATQNEPNLNQ